MKSMRWLVRGSLVFVLSMSAGCVLFGGDDDDVPSCSQAINSFYDEGCTFLLGGEPVSASDMIGQCQEGISEAPGCGCQSEMDDLLICIDDVRNEQCNRCDQELVDMSECFDGC